jgi:CDP-glucose 4,6-dehydratase
VTPFWRSRRVFVTGHTGFKGSWLSLVLAQAGAEVVGYSNGVPTRPSHYEDARVGELITSVEGDVRDSKRLAREIERSSPEVVFHLAAQALVRRSYAEPLATYETNVLGTANLLESVRDTDVRAVVVVTSDKVYAPQPGRRHTEDDPLGGNDPYSASKAAAELVTAAYRHAFFGSTTGAAVATARAGNVIGGGDWAEDRLVPDVVRALTAGQPLEIRYPHALRPWQHVLDPIEGYLVLAERLCTDGSAARAWNFGPDADSSQTVERVALGIAAAWGEQLAFVPSTAQSLPEASSLELDATRARIELGWEPRWDLERGVRETAEWYRRREAGEDPRALTLGQIEAHAEEARRPAVAT